MFKTISIIIIIATMIFTTACSTINTIATDDLKNDILKAVLTDGLSKNRKYSNWDIDVQYMEKKNNTHFEIWYMRAMYDYERSYLYQVGMTPRKDGGTDFFIIELPQKNKPTTSHGFRKGVHFIEGNKKAYPNPMENDWIKMEAVGPQFAKNLKTGKVEFMWAMTFTPKINDTVVIQVYDVTGEDEELIMLNESFQLQKNRYNNLFSHKILFSKQSCPWFFNEQNSHYTFKIVITNSQNEQRIINQPFVTTSLVKAKILTSLSQQKIK